MSNGDPRQFDYSQLLNGQRPTPPANVPRPEDIAQALDQDRIDSRPVRQFYGRGGEATPPPPTREAAASSNRVCTLEWVERNGKRERVCDMHPAKLRGCLKLLKRAAVTWRAMALVDILARQESDLPEGTTLNDIINSSWRDHVPEPRIFAGMEADWQRRFRNEPWDDAADEDNKSLGRLADQVQELMGRLSTPEKVTIVTNRARRQINL